MLRVKFPHGFLKKLKIFGNEAKSLKNNINLIEGAGPAWAMDAHRG